MFRVLRGNRWLKGAIGIAAAYIIAAQMMLAGLAAAQMAATDHADQNVICYGSGAPDSGSKGATKIHRASCVICAVASFSPPIPDVVTACAFGPTAEIALQVPPPAPLSHAPQDTPRTSRGPPQTV